MAENEKLDSVVGAIVQKLTAEWTPEKLNQVATKIGDLFAYTEKIKQELKMQNPDLENEDIVKLACQVIEERLVEQQRDEMGQEEK